MGVAFCMAGSDSGWDVSRSYGGFNKFREEIASLIGLNLNEMKGFGVPSDPLVPWKSDIRGAKPWRGIKDPLRYLLNHSDCDGYIGPRRCALIAPRLLDIAPNLKDEFDRKFATDLAALMKLCAKKSKRLEFM